MTERLCLQEDTFEETGWKLVHGDVFRPPKYTKMLASLVGSGAQLLCSSFFVIGETCFQYYGSAKTVDTIFAKTIIQINSDVLHRLQSSQ